MGGWDRCLQTPAWRLLKPRSQRPGASCRNSNLPRAEPSECSICRLTPRMLLCPSTASLRGSLESVWNRVQSLQDFPPFPSPSLSHCGNFPPAHAEPAAGDAGGRTSPLFSARQAGSIPGPPGTKRPGPEVGPETRSCCRRRGCSQPLGGPRGKLRGDPRSYPAPEALSLAEPPGPPLPLGGSTKRSGVRNGCARGAG